MRVQTALLGNHPCQQRCFEDIERKSESKIARALEQKARQAAVAADMELVSHVAGRQRHAVEIGDVPPGKDVPP